METSYISGDVAFRYPGFEVIAPLFKKIQELLISSYLLVLLNLVNVIVSP